MARVIATRKTGSAVVHAAAQSGVWAGAPVFERTVCGQEIKADGTWQEVGADGVRAALANKTPHYVSDAELRACKRCGKSQRYSLAGVIATDPYPWSESAPRSAADELVTAANRRAADIAAVRAADIAMPEEETSAPVVWLIGATGEAHLIFLVTAVVRADTGARIVQARTVCGIMGTGETRSDRPPFMTLCPDCVLHDAQNGGSLPLPEETGAPEEETSAPVVQRRFVEDRDTYALLVNGINVGTVDSTRDRTGDRYARRASGEIVAPRFLSTIDAETYLRGGERPALCADGGAHAYGACIRPAGHYEVHVSAQGHRWSDADTARIVADRTSAPEEETSAPEEETSAPEEETSAPEEETSAPKEETANSIGHRAAHAARIGAALPVIRLADGRTRVVCGARFSPLGVRLIYTLGPSDGYRHDELLTVIGTRSF